MLILKSRILVNEDSAESADIGLRYRWRNRSEEKRGMARANQDKRCFLCIQCSLERRSATETLQNVSHVLPGSLELVDTLLLKPIQCPRTGLEPNKPPKSGLALIKIGQFLNSSLESLQAHAVWDTLL